MWSSGRRDASLDNHAWFAISQLFCSKGFLILISILEYDVEIGLHLPKFRIGLSSPFTRTLIETIHEMANFFIRHIVTRAIVQHQKLSVSLDGLICVIYCSVPICYIYKRLQASSFDVACDFMMILISYRSAKAKRLCFILL